MWSMLPSVQLKFFAVIPFSEWPCTSIRASAHLPTLSTAALDSTSLNGNTLPCAPLCLFSCVRNAFVRLGNNDSPAFCVNGAVWKKLREQMNWHLLSLHPRAVRWKHRINARKRPRGEVPWNGSKPDLKRLGYRQISAPKALAPRLKHTALCLTGAVASSRVEAKG